MTMSADRLEPNLSDAEMEYRVVTINGRGRMASFVTPQEAGDELSRRAIKMLKAGGFMTLKEAYDAVCAKDKVLKQIYALGQ
jgi:hypothetical protein